MNRRALLGMGVLGAAGLVARPARATVTPTSRKFVFITSFYGWDPTTVFTNQLDNENVHTPDDDQATSSSGIAYVANDKRSAVTDFFETWADKAVVINGINVGSVSHAVCMMKMLTGSNAATNSDWAAILGAEQAGSYGLPTVVVQGPGFTGGLAGTVCRIGSSGQIDALLEGSLAAQGDVATATFSDEGRQRVRDWAHGRGVARRGLARTAREASLATAGLSALERADLLRSVRTSVRWGSDGSLSSQVDLATDLLANGLSRSVALGFESADWDSHADNDEKQSANFQALFEGLNRLMANLASVTTATGTLADETVVVALSEMGRTPLLNGGAGKDHWPATSAMLVGGGLRGGRTIGGYTELLAADTMNFSTGTPGEGEYLQPTHLGATLIALGGADPADWLPDPTVVDTLLE